MFRDGTLPVEAPLVLSDPANVDWDGECEVLVIGYGAAGAAAAIAAREAGADARIVERFEGGGATARSGGIIYLGGGTPYQRKHGYEDSADAMFRYLRNESGDAVSESALRRFCEDSLSLNSWLDSIGVRFDSEAPPPKTSYPKDGVFLYYSGNEGVPSFAAQAIPAPRGHRVRGSWMSGRNLFEQLDTRVEQLQIPVQRQAGVRRLVLDTEGRALGADVYQLEPGSKAALEHARLIRRAEQLHNFLPGYADRLRARALKLELSHARLCRLRASRGVVIASGGFIFNRAMVRDHAPLYAQTLRLGATGCDGSGIRLGQSAGGQVARLNKVSAWRFINPPSQLPRGVVINARGERFCNEQVYGARLGVEMCEHHQGRAWIILDAQLRRLAIREALFGGLWPFQKYPALFLMLFARRARTAEALAKKIGVPPDALHRTLDRYNADAAAGRPDALGKSADMVAALAQPPYYALDISVANGLFPCPAITLGGLAVEETSNRVLDATSKPIEGLYAAGRSAVGIASNHYVSGLSLADCLWSGLRAGAHAAGRPRTILTTPAAAREPDAVC